MCFTCRQYACSCMHSTTARWKLGCMCVYDSVFFLGGGGDSTPGCCHADSGPVLLMRRCRWWPAQELNQPWQVLVEAVYPLLAAAPLLWTQAGGGSWLTAGQALFPDTTWAGGAEAHTDLVEALLLLQLPLVQLPPAVLGLLKRYGVSHGDLSAQSAYFVHVHWTCSAVQWPS